ncbi:hypothetical protein SCHPADRAFT_947438 [Schizopora paradoxa]|uniref:Uncharacterized protein n=1 Tax=Schizopora paradoxa TaxID=27342 RepID=A0A0H2QZG4_9AGAM|nr:hypothetical protein SCHPADRAFT_947438 [Schizopora paradoxa]
MLTYAIRAGSNPISAMYTDVAHVKAAQDEIERCFPHSRMEEVMPDKGRECVNGFKHGVLVCIETNKKTFGKVFLLCVGKDHYTAAPSTPCEKHLEDLGELESDEKQEVCRMMFEMRQQRAEDKLEAHLDQVKAILFDASKGVSHRFFTTNSSSRFRQYAFHRLDVAHRMFHSTLEESEDAVQTIRGAYLHYSNVNKLNGHLNIDRIVYDLIDDLREVVLEAKPFVLKKDKAKHDLLW